MNIKISDTIAPVKLDLNDLVDREEALKILKITSASLSVYISIGKVRVVSRNGNGKPFFSRRDLHGIK